eukprot:jgi/Chrzof1/10223/Cz04g33060.t1
MQPLACAGVGRPQMKKILFPTSNQSFQKCMDAIRSNIDLDDKITLVLETRNSASDIRQQQQQQPQQSVGSTKAADSVFDPRLFE